jgi:hypothetical protein
MGTLFFVGAFTVAYYQTPGKTSDVKWGPVPGVAAGCGRFKPNVIFVPSTSGQISCCYRRINHNRFQIESRP